MQLLDARVDVLLEAMLDEGSIVLVVCGLQEAWRLLLPLLVPPSCSYLACRCRLRVYRETDKINKTRRSAKRSVR